MPGPARKPSAIRNNEGDLSNRPPNEREPENLDGLPVCPPHVTGEAKAEWDRICRDLSDMGILSREHRPALTAYVDTWAEFVKQSTSYAKTGPVIKTTNGNFVQNPLCGVVNRLKDDLRKWLIEFGLTPAARTRVEVRPANLNNGPDVENHFGPPKIADVG
jgi:P27 family predicted phage terminase small subunit